MVTSIVEFIISKQCVFIMTKVICQLDKLFGITIHPEQQGLSFIHYVCTITRCVTIG